MSYESPWGGNRIIIFLAVVRDVMISWILVCVGAVWSSKRIQCRRIYLALWIRKKKTLTLSSCIGSKGRLWIQDSSYLPPSPSTGGRTKFPPAAIPTHPIPTAIPPRSIRRPAIPSSRRVASRLQRPCRVAFNGYSTGRSIDSTGRSIDSTRSSSKATVACRPAGAPLRRSNPSTGARTGCASLRQPHDGGEDRTASRAPGTSSGPQPVEPAPGGNRSAEKGSPRAPEGSGPASPRPRGTEPSDTLVLEAPERELRPELSALGSHFTAFLDRLLQDGGGGRGRRPTGAGASSAGRVPATAPLEHLLLH